MKDDLHTWHEIIVIADTPNINGVVYSREELERAFERYMAQPNRFGSLSPDSSFDKISHHLKSVAFEGDVLYGEIEILRTPFGNLLKDLLKTVPRSLTLGLIAKATMDNTVRSKDLFEESGLIATNVNVEAVCVLDKDLTNH